MEEGIVAEEIHPNFPSTKQARRGSKQPAARTHAAVTVRGEGIMRRAWG
jgi:hypothetical protein